MNKLQRSEAYRAIADHFNLRAPQRNALDALENLTEVLEAAHAGRWRVVESLIRGNVLTINVDLPVFMPSFERWGE